MKLQRKLFLRFVPLLLIIFVFCLLGGWTFFSYKQSIFKVKQDVEPSGLAMLELKRALVSMEKFTAAGAVDKKKLKRLVQRLETLADKHLAHEQHPGDPSHNIAHDIKHRVLRSIKYANYLSHLEEHSWKNKAETQEFYAAVHQEYNELSNLLDEHLSLHLQDLAITTTIMSRQYQTGMTVIWCGAVLGILATLYGIYSLVKIVLVPIETLQQCVRRIGNGKFENKCSLRTGDEFEELAMEFENMARKLEKYYQELDGQVEARTRELSRANAELQTEILERKQAEKEQLRAEAQVHLLTQKILKIQETERKRIALDLHDNVAQELSALKATAETFLFDRTGEGSQLQEQMEAWTKILNRCIATVRELSYNLRPPSIEQLGLIGALADLCGIFSRQSGLQIDFMAAGMERLSLDMGYEVAINIYRLVQEALNNIQEHAAAETVTVRLVASGPSVVLRIEDDGRGCDLAEVEERTLSEKRLGLLGMQERVRLLEGSFKIRSAPGKGMKIYAEIPCDNVAVSVEAPLPMS